MKKLPYLFLLLLITFSGCKEAESSKITVITPEEMQSFLEADNVQLIDVRTQEEYNKGHIKGAQNINFFSPTFFDDINKLDKEKPVYLYCNSGKRSANCAEKMIEIGFVKIYDLEGGFSKWKHEGSEVEK
ncbi:rhodanese-like domain-containing protein [Confluentibacter flavum]|uniref:Rhodanese-like domain-containing protein n=1 Tax=Confluentibacter flavum TaxID=1909700 RepID=A0A2N3HF40_9FLAO|nr:rhodanese-like domain-containing protein [Confluentibacter flavum]PKQ43601.1 rhodanese-like domain-containing protein [Confluentibacter flavum]